MNYFFLYQKFSAINKYNGFFSKKSVRQIITTALFLVAITFKAIAQASLVSLSKVTTQGAASENWAFSNTPKPPQIPANWSKLLVEQHEAITTDHLRIHVFRLRPGDDLLESVRAYVKQNHIHAAILLSAVGSLAGAAIRYANRPTATLLTGYFEIVSITGTVEEDGEHIHLSIATGQGNVIGGHLMAGCKVYTTCEIALGELMDVQFTRELDKEGSGWNELKVNFIGPSQ